MRFVNNFSCWIKHFITASITATQKNILRRSSYARPATNGRANELELNSSAPPRQLAPQTNRKIHQVTTAHSNENHESAVSQLWRETQCMHPQ